MVEQSPETRRCELPVVPNRHGYRWLKGTQLVYGIQAVEKVPDTIGSINNEAKCARRTTEKLLEAGKALESLTLKVAIAVAELAFASPREPPDKMSPGQDAFGNVKECPSDLDARVLDGGTFRSA